MSKVRINDLARELEVKSKSILDALTAVGVTEKKTHSSSIEADEAEKVRAYVKGGSRSQAQRTSHEAPKFDLSKVSKPGDALKAILERKQAEAAAKSASPAMAARPAVVAPPSNPVVAHPATSAPVAPSVAQASAPRPGAVAGAGPGIASGPGTVSSVAASSAPAAVQPSAPGAAAAANTVPGAPPAPRRIVPQPRQQANIIAPPQAAPAIASRPPAGPVVAVRPRLRWLPPPERSGTGAVAAGRGSACCGCGPSGSSVCSARPIRSGTHIRSGISFCSGLHTGSCCCCGGGSCRTGASRGSCSACNYAADRTAPDLHGAASGSGSSAAQSTHL